MLFNMSVIDILIILPILIISLTIHEYAHAWVSTVLGDPTPGNHRRLTLNPLSHLDPFGTLMLLVAGFGWARPVPIDISYYRRRHLGLVLTSLAGPLSNLSLAVLVMGLLRLLVMIPAAGLGARFLNSMFEILQQAAFLNLVLFVLNMIPIPPLDGSRLVTAALRHRPDLAVPYNRYGGYLLFGLIILGRVAGINLLPVTPVASVLFALLFGVFF